MSKTKLEVGKTYRNRKGEEVKIVKKDSRGRYQFRGNNGEWYAENGRYLYYLGESSRDLIEEVTLSDETQKFNKMEKIKLEVGKTYRNRKGEEVMIVEKDGEEYPYKGSDGEWYTENGRFDVHVEESLLDLIEELPEPRYAFITPDDMKKVTAHRYTFTIPEGTKGVNVSKEGNRIIVEMVPEAKEPKPGDVLVNEQGSVYIFQSVLGYGNHNYYVRVGKSGHLSFEWTCASGRPATPEEAQPLWDALKKAGKRWNPETMQVEEIPERERIMAFLQGYANKVTWDCRQLCLLIEAYLKHKEDEK